METDLNVKDSAQLTQIQLIDEIISRTENKKWSEESMMEAEPFIVEYARRNCISEDSALLFAAFFNDFTDTRIWIKDIARFFDCSQVKILTKWSAIEELVAKRLVTQYKKDDGELYFAIPNEVVAALREDKKYSPDAKAHLTIDKWFAALSKLLNAKDQDKIPYTNFIADLHVLINSNKHLVVTQELSTIKGDVDLVIFAGIMDLFVRNNDNHVIREDLEDLFETRWDMRTEARLLERGIHPLQQAGLIEHSDSDGQVEANAWKMTDVAKERFLVEVDCTAPIKDDKNIQKAESITEKPLFFNALVSKQMAQLESLLQEDRFAAVQENLAKHGMRRGFACIFYGAPGTGKTESVLQLARKTGRGIMIVDVPNLRDKFVGETEKTPKLSSINTVRSARTPNWLQFYCLTRQTRCYANEMKEQQKVWTKWRMRCRISSCKRWRIWRES